MRVLLLCVLLLAVPMSNWGRVYYTNLLSGIALLLVFPLCKSEHQILRTYAFSNSQICLLVLSCMIGVCMSHAGRAAASSRLLGLQDWLFKASDAAEMKCRLQLIKHISAQLAAV